MMKKIFANRISRRAFSCSVILSAFVVVWALSPVLFVAALLADVRHGWADHKWLRLLGFLMLYLINDAWALVMLLVMWIVTGFGWKMHTSWSYKMHARVHGQWASHLLWGVDKLFGGRIEIRNRDVVTPGPIAMFSRHICFLDALIPSVLIAHKRSQIPCHVMKDDLKWEPGIDILGHRTPNHFLNRAKAGALDLDAVRRIGEAASTDNSVVIFPEGSFRQPARFARAIERMRKSQPALAERASKLKHVLPPRPNGSFALLQGAADADVVLVAHSGFDGFTTVKEILANVPLNRRIVIECRRIPRSEIPMDEEGFNDWLLAQYEWIDAFVEEQLNDGTSRRELAAKSEAETAVAADLRDQVEIELSGTQSDANV